MAIVTEIPERTRILDVGKTETRGQKRYKIEPASGESEEACYAALLAAVPATTAYGTLIPFNVMFPTRYHIERVEYDLFWGRVEFSTKSENAIEYEHRGGVATLACRTDRNYNPLPAGARAELHLPTELFIYRRTEIAAAWGKGGQGAPSASGSQWQRTAYCRGCLNSGSWLGRVAGYWMFENASSIYQADGTHRVEYIFAGRHWEYGRSGQILWEYVADDGALFQMNTRINFATVFSDLVWPDGTAIT